MNQNSNSMWVILMINPFLPPETESENEFRPLDGRIDEFHPKATRTLFIGNLEKTTSYQQLLDIFQRFGEIVVSIHLTLNYTRKFVYFTFNILYLLSFLSQGHWHQESKWSSPVCLCPVFWYCQCLQGYKEDGWRVSGSQQTKGSVCTLSNLTISHLCMCIFSKL